MALELRPLAEGNRVQRWYAAWAQPHYERMPPDVREGAELLDRFLYSRRGLGVWAGLLCAVAGSAAGLSGAGMPWWLALFLSTALWLVIPLIGLTAWLAPNNVLGRKPLKKYLVGVALGMLGSVIGFAAGHVQKHGRLDWLDLGDALARNIGVIAPVVVLVISGMGLLIWGVAHIRRGMLQQKLERASLAREAAEARLRLLQGQIQPHFIFNTLSALQHWVDTGDRRAGSLLRSLTAFLRGSTELLGRDQTTLGEEATMVGHYLAIQQARLGERLAYNVQIAPGLETQPLPPGLLLTLVENAVEHGIAPALVGGRVTLSASVNAKTCRVCVDDSGIGLASGWQEGIGLANCRARLEHRFGVAASLDFEALHPGTRARILIAQATP